MTPSSDRTLIKTLAWTALSTAVKIGQSFMVFKLLAVKFSPEGLGRVSNVTTLSMVLDQLSGAGIINGVNKYVAEFSDDPQQLQSLLGTASAIIISFSTLVALVLLVATQRISHLLGAPTEYLWLIKSTSVIQFAIAVANLLRSMLKGKGDAIGNSLSTMSGSLLGVIAFWLSLQHYGYQGAEAGLAMMHAWTIIPACIIFYRHAHLPIAWLKPTWNAPLATSLFRFSLMTFTNTILGWITFRTVRMLLTTYDGLIEVGMWQAMRKISDNYFHITTSFLSVYLLPLLSYSQHRPTIVRTTVRTLRFVIPLAMVISLLLWLLRDWLILLLFSSKFGAMRDLYGWQLSGDLFRIGSAVFMSLILAKALLAFHLLSELLVFLLTLFFSYQFIPTQGAVGASQAYFATQVIYFILCLAVAAYYAQRA
jgi:antigen flippase